MCFKRIQNRLLTLTFFFLSLLLYSQDTLTTFVNPFIGTGGHGHTFPGAVLPFGMVQLSPDTRIDGSWDGCGGYHYSDSVIYGFSHTHLSGTGISDWGDILLMPMSAKPSFDKKEYSSKFTHSREKAGAGFYEVYLEDEKIKAELTTTLRTGIHRYTFPTANEIAIVLDLLHRDKLLSSRIKVLDSCTVIGCRISEAWVKEQHCYFAIRFSQPIKKINYSKGHKELSKADSTADQSIFYFQSNGKPLMVKVGISSVSSKGALNNLEKEAAHWDFEKYKKEANDAWNKQLNKIVIVEKDKDRASTFYTALYHCCIHPSLNMDYDNQYRGRDNKIHTAKGFTNYSVFSLWDTYRALHPLFTIIERKRSADFINTFLVQYKQGGRLPVWELSGNETDCMIGYHSVSVIADAMVKKIDGFDTTLVFEAIKAAATYSGYGIPAYIQKGYLSADDEPESVSKTLEYSYDDWCISQIMKRAGKIEDYKTFIKRAQGYKNVFDPSTGFMRPRKNGGWLSPFDPKEVNNHYTEGNSWQYSFYVPHDISHLIELHGGDKKFEEKLDSLFTTGSQTSGRIQDDITGLIGQYAQGNEPSHHMAYLYNYIGKPFKTQDKVAQIMNDFYKNSPDGLIGNEDCGQMSAWYVFSSLGFYPVCPGNAEYVIGKPLFTQAKINLEDGKEFLITKYSNTGESKYIHSVKINNRPSFRSALTHLTIITGGSMTFSFQPKMTDDNKFGTSFMLRPMSKIAGSPIIPAPVINSDSKSFLKEQFIAISSLYKKKDTIVYTINGSEPSKQSSRYTGPFNIRESCTVKTRVYSSGDSSKITDAHFYKKPHDWKITIKSKYNKQYTAGGDEGIIDGIYGDVNWRKGEWQGYQYQDFECVIDLNQPKEISSVSLDFLQDTRAWIIFPTSVDILVSNDNISFTPVESIKNTVDAKDYNVQVKRFDKKFPKRSARYIKLIAHNFGTLPEWHEGKGDGAFIFIDEIEIK
ncbi:MAG: GH92 family glycosyl hydrolase [Bacteroidia bacterium]